MATKNLKKAQYGTTTGKSRGMSDPNSGMNRPTTPMGQAKKGAIVKKKMAKGGSASSALKTFNDNKAMAYKKAGGAMDAYRKTLKKAQNGTVVKDKWGRPPGSKWYGFNPTTKKYERVFETPKAENQAKIQTAREKEVIDSPTQTYAATTDGQVYRMQNDGSGVPGKDRYGKSIDTTGYAAGQPTFDVTTYGPNNKLSYTSIPRENVLPMLKRWKNETLGTRKTGGATMAKGAATKAKKFAALAPPYYKATAADRIAGAKKNKRK